MEVFNGDTVVLGFIVLFDLVSTIYLMSIGMASEGNPLMATFAQMGTTTLVAAKLATCLPFFALVEVYRASRPNRARAVTRIVSCCYVAAYVVGTLQINLLA